jgi:hypothetical protein
MLIRSRRKAPTGSTPWPRLVLHALLGFSLTVFIVLVLYAPAFWGIEDKWSFFLFWRDRIKEITWGQNNPFSLHPFIQVFFRTPLLVLLLAMIGLFKALRDYRKSPLYSLLLLWLFLPMVIICLPSTLIYHNGMRHFMVFLVPFCLLATIGLVSGAGFIADRMKADRKMILRGGAAVAIGINLWGIISTHPYQTTFFNVLAGGLKGAQEKKITDSCDYWLNSYREAGRWINLFGVRNANVLAVYLSGTPPFFNTGLIKDAIHRPDMRLIRLPAIPIRGEKIMIPGNTYVILVPYDYLSEGRTALEQTGQFEKVYAISRQGGEICTIYYKPGPSFPVDPTKGK